MRRLLLTAALLLPVALQGQTPVGTRPGVTFAFVELVTLGPAITPGRTARGERNIIPITGGTFEGPGIRGTVLPGGWDWQLKRPDGCTEIKADYMLRTDDGVVINIVNEGTLCAPVPGHPFSARTQPRFEAPSGKYDWLSRNAFVGTLEPAKAQDGSAAVRIGVWLVN